ncbi:MAG TPA: FecR domain-containing protein [Stellaceae bacterium]|jgi:hypothetical protein
MLSPAPRSLWLGAAVAAALLATAQPAAAQRVGVSSAVNPATTGQPPGGTVKTLLVGENIVFNEHINTGSDGQTQLLFVDESAMSIGPNSDMTIDEFVYNPKTGTGTAALSATRGVFRYVGGKLSKGETPVTIKTPVATIGIRGGVFVMSLDPSGNLDVVFLYGNGLTITGLNGISQTITRPGFAVTVNGRGASPSSPTHAASGTLTSFITQLDGHNGGSGGATQVPTDSTVTNSGVTQTVSGNINASVQSAIQTQLGQTQTQNQTPTTNNVAQNNLNTTGSQSQPQIAAAAGGNTTPQTPPPPPPPTNTVPAVPPGGPLAGATTQVVTANRQSGFTTPLVPYSGGSVSNGVFIAPIGDDTLSVSLAQGTATLYTPSGNFTLNASPVVNSDGTFFYSGFSVANDPTKIAFGYGGLPAGAGAYTPSPNATVKAFQIQPDFALGSPVPFVPNQIGGQIPNRSVSPLYLAIPAGTGLSNGSFQGTKPAILQASLAIDGIGADQTSALVVATGNVIVTTGNPGQTTPQPVLTGAAEGSYRSNGTTPQTLINTSLLTGIDATGNSFYGNNNVEGFVVTPNGCCSSTDGSQIPQLATATNTATNAMTNYGFVQPALAVQAPAVASGPQTAQTLSGLVGGTMVGTVNGTSTPYAVIGGIAITTNPAAMQISSAIAGVDPFTSSQSGVSSFNYVYGFVPGQSGNMTNQGYINDNLFGALQAPAANSNVNGNLATNANLYMVNANAVPNNSLLPSTGLCVCQYLQWGYWGGEVDTGSGSTARTDIAHINTWVAGIQTPAADIGNLTSMSATANFTGNAIGTVSNNGASYLASGTFAETYHFGNFTGNLSINNFDGKSVSGSIAGGPRSPAYAGSLSGSNLTGAAAGFFFGPNAAETGGSFAVKSISGLPYQAAGVFGGAKH